MSVKGKGAELSKEKAARQAIQRLQGSRRRSVRQNRQCPTHPTSRKRIMRRNAPTMGPRERPIPSVRLRSWWWSRTVPTSSPEAATFIGECDVVRYVMEPMRFRKIIYKVRKYVQDEKIYKGSAPATPLLNSQYTSSLHCRTRRATLSPLHAS